MKDFKEMTPEEKEEILEQIRKYNTTVKILLITAFCTDESFKEEVYQEARIWDVIEKSVMMNEHKPRIEEIW